MFRYFVDGSNKVLWERFFHLEDVVKDLPPLIKQFHASEEGKSGKPGGGTRLAPPKFEPTPRKLDAPIQLDDFINKNFEEIKYRLFKLK